jgi:hypothetical protein
MARSSYIYVLLGLEDDIIAAFTVKHEMETFRARYGKPTSCLRFRDNQPQVAPTEVED